MNLLHPMKHRLTVWMENLPCWNHFLCSQELQVQPLSVAKKRRKIWNQNIEQSICRRLSHSHHSEYRWHIDSPNVWCSIHSFRSWVVPQANSMRPQMFRWTFPERSYETLAESIDDADSMYPLQTQNQKPNISISISSNRKYTETYPNSWSIRCQGNCAIICRKRFSPCVSSTKVQFADLRVSSWRRMGRTAPKHEWPNRITWMLAIPLRAILKIEKKRKIAMKRNCIFVGGHGQIGQTSTDDNVQKQW